MVNRAALLLDLWMCAAAFASPTVLLNNGVLMPIILWGSGGSTQENSTATASAVRDALQAGFPGIDCANHYHNQDGVARGIALSGVPRSAIWLQTKIEPCGHSLITPIYQHHCYGQSLKAFDDNLHELATDQVDLTLLHSPPCVLNSTWADPQCYWPDQPDAVYPQHCDCAAPEPCSMMQAQWAALELRYKQNKTRSIGVSNFCKPCLECLAKTATVTPAVNQLQLHVGMPGEDPAGLVSYSGSKGIAVQAYSPLGGDQHAALLGNSALQRVAKAHNASSTSQVCLRWVSQLGHAMCTSTTRTDFMAEDLEVASDNIWTMSAAEMAELAVLDVAPDDPVKSMCLLS
jgi:diketogulonate reductase-like aldo/keto reductase